MRDIKVLGHKLGHNQELASALWKTGVYEARMLASFVGDPAKLTARGWTVGARPSTTGNFAMR